MITKVTVTEIAAAAGVSQATVSAALHGRGRVGEACRLRIVALSREMGYEPRVAAQLLRAKHTNQLGMVVASQNSVIAFHQEVQRLTMGYLVEQCDRLGMRYVMEFHHHEQDQATSQFVPPNQITARLVDGTVLLGDVGDPLRQWLRERGNHPWVSIEEPAEFCVLSAADVGVKLAVEMLRGLGHRRVAYCGGAERYSQQRLGQRAFEAMAGEVMKTAVVQLFGHEQNEATVAGIHQWATHLLQDPTRPTAIICVTEYMARAVIHAAIELGLQVPRDLSVISYGSVLEAERRYPRLTTIENDYADMTAQAMELVLAQIQKQPIEQPRRSVAPRLMPGRTVGPAPVGTA